MLENYKRAFARLNKMVPLIAAQYKTSPIRIYFGALMDYLVYGVTPNEYLGWQFYAKSRLEKNTFYSARRYNKYEKRLNDPKYYDVFWKKELFNQTFSEFISRDWLYVPNASNDEIGDFIKAHKKVIVKPTTLSSGKGIHIYDNDTIEDLRLGGGIVRGMYSTM